MQNKTHLLFCLFFFVFLKEEHKLLHISRERHLRKPQQKARKCFKHSAQEQILRGLSSAWLRTHRRNPSYDLASELWYHKILHGTGQNSPFLGCFVLPKCSWENYMRFVAVLFQIEYGTRKQKCWKFLEKSHSTELTSSKRVKKSFSFTTAAAEGRFRSILPTYYPFSGSFTWCTTTHSQFAPCQQQPASTAQKLGFWWIKLYQSNTNALEIQHSLK